jgi:hypothetical protein
MKVIGTIETIFETEDVNDNLRKRCFVLAVSDNPKYVEHIKFELYKERITLLDNFEVGTKVEVYFNLKGRQWKNNQGIMCYINTLQAWQILRVAS